MGSGNSAGPTMWSRLAVTVTLIAAAGAGAGASVAQGQTRGRLPAPWELTTAPNAARVFVDVSGSMAGFDRTPGGPLEGLLTAIKNELLVEGVAKYEARPFGTTLGPAHPVSGPTDAMALPARDASTCLVLPLQEVTNMKPLTRASGIDIVITDSVASNNRSDCGALCGAGSDVSCVASAVAAYVRSGRGLWLVGVRMPFQGRYYPAAGGGALPVAAGGVRPLYVWFGASSVEAGRRVTKAAQAWAARRGLDAIAAEVWPSQWEVVRAPLDDQAWTQRGFQVAPGTLPVCQARANLGLKRLPTAQDPVLELVPSKPGPQQVWLGRLPLQDVSSQPPPVPWLLAMKLRWPPVVVGGQPVGTILQDDRRNWATCLLMTGRDLQLALEWDVSVAVPSSVASWSTSNDRDANALDKTLNLHELWGLVARLLEADAQRGLRTAVLELRR